MSIDKSFSGTSIVDGKKKIVGIYQQVANKMQSEGRLALANSRELDYNLAQGMRQVKDDFQRAVNSGMINPSLGQDLHLKYL